MIEFGDYVHIGQKRHGRENEMYTYKVIGTLKSNGYVDVPAQEEKETFHSKIVDVVACICCGVEERQVSRFRIEDVSH